MILILAVVKSMVTRREFCGELLGTFLLVFFGLATVAAAVTLGVHVGLFQVAALWGLALIVAITVSAESSGAHLNPAMTLAFASVAGFSWRKVPGYVLGQCVGAFLAAALVYALFRGAIVSFEDSHHLIRGEAGSELSAMMFGEYFPNPAMALEMKQLEHVGFMEGFLSEGLGTALLAFVVFSVVGQRRDGVPSWLIPIVIGLGLTVIIAIFAPFSMGGFNPARDLMPRIVASLAGWGTHPFKHNGHGWLTVYILAPIVGAQVGALAAQLLCKGKNDSLEE